MTDTISYPTDDMSSTSRRLTSFLDEQWQQHTALFMNNDNSYAALLLAIANVIPNAQGKSEDLAAALNHYQQQYQQCYQALRELAQNIDTAAQAMAGTDQQVADGFK